MTAYFLGIDQGTTLTTAVLVDAELWQIAGRGHCRHRQIYPRPGWVEHDPEEILRSVVKASTEALAQIPGARPQDIVALGLDHQGETCLLWDKASGRPLANAIVWQDRRTADEAERLKAELGDQIHRSTGLWPDSYYSATKISWLLDHIPDARRRAAKGEILAGTLNSWLIWKLSGGRAFVTDGCSGGRWMLMDLKSLRWNEKIASAANVPLGILPPIADCDSIFAQTEPELFLGLKIPISGCLTDSHAGLVGGGLCRPGSLKTSYGTGAFMNLVTGDDFIISQRGLMATCCWLLGGRPSYTLNGACYIAGAAVQWLKDGLELIGDIAEAEALARSVPDSHGVYFVPAFAGLATPDWDQYARGAFLGLTGGVQKAHLARAVLESVAFEVAQCHQAMKEEYSGEIPAMRADGGMVDNEFLMRFQADIMGLPVELPEEKESAAFGSAAMAALGLGQLSSLKELRDKVKIKKVYEPAMSEDERLGRLERWRQAVERCLGWAREA